MYKIAIIGANEFQNQLILKAKELGYETFVFAWKSGDIGEFSADHFIPISIVEKEKIWECCKKNNIDACVSVGSDLAIHTVNYIQRKLNRPCNPEITDIVSTNKYEMRKAFLTQGVQTPKFVKTDEVPSKEALLGMKYPLIVKPTDRSGSRGIYKVNDYDELCKSVIASLKQSFEKKVIIEEYIEGEEYSCEAVSYNGKHRILAFTKKFTTGSPHFIETGHMEPADIPSKHIERIKNQIYAAIDSLKIKNGASHTEFKLDDSFNVHIIEIGSRMGGDFIGSDLVQLSTGYDFLKMVIDISLGKEPTFEKINDPKKAYVNFILNKNDLDYYYSRRGTINIIRERINIDKIDYNVTDSSSRHGYYIYTDKRF